MVRVFAISIFRNGRENIAYYIADGLGADIPATNASLAGSIARSLDEKKLRAVDLAKALDELGLGGAFEAIYVDLDAIEFTDDEPEVIPLRRGGHAPRWAVVNRLGKPMLEPGVYEARSDAENALLGGRCLRR